MKGLIKKIYIGGALTHASETQKCIYKNIGKLCEKYSESIYVPHLNGTDPVRNPEVSAQKVWEVDYKEVSTSEIMIAYLGEPSLGTGGELEIIRMAGGHIIAWWFYGQKVSRLPRGNPAVVESIIATDENTLYTAIESALVKIIQTRKIALS